MPTALPHSPPRFYRRLSATERVFAAFMATCACIILGLSALVLIRGWDKFPSASDRLRVLAIAVLALGAAGLFLRTLRKGRSLAPIHEPDGIITTMVSAAALGDPHAVTALQRSREKLRQHVEILALLPPPLRAQVRGAYSYTVEAITRVLADLESPLVQASPADDVAPKETVMRRLEGELAVWKADFAWFEQVESRLSA